MMYDNKISAEAAQKLVQAIQNNNTLELLMLPSYVEKRIRSLQVEVSKNRESRRCLTKLNIVFVQLPL